MDDALRTFDQVTLQILWHRLIGIVDEAALTLVRTSFSQVVQECNDYSCTIMDRHGRALADNSVSIPAFMGTLPRTMRHILTELPIETWRPGDVVITNDPWLGTGHLLDFSMVAPVFRDERIVAFVGAVAHAVDIGGLSWASHARSVFEEGVRIPISKLVEAGTPNELLLRTIRANVRLPEIVVGDLFAQLAACRACSQRLLEFLDDAGLDDLDALAEAIQGRCQSKIEYSARMTDSKFAIIDFPRFFGADPGGSTAISGIQNFALTVPFAAMSEEELAELQDLDSGVLERLLRFHITQGAWHRPTGALRMLDDNVAQTYGGGRDFRIEQATILDQARYRNGIVATIDTVISPPEPPWPGETSLTATSHENKFTLNGSQSISGTFGAHSVTSGQPYGPVSFESPDKIVINAGRKNSSGPAQFFMNRLTANNVLTGLSGGDKTPRQLNFAQVLVSLQPTVSGRSFICSNVKVGQGHTLTNNNWWVGQEGAVLLNDHTLQQQCRASGPTSCRLTTSPAAADRFILTASCDE